MVSDTLQIAICGDMPDMTGRLACREDIRYNLNPFHTAVIKVI